MAVLFSSEGMPSTYTLSQNTNKNNYNFSVTSERRFCPGVPVHRGITIVLSFGLGVIG